MTEIKSARYNIKITICLIALFTYLMVPAPELNAEEIHHHGAHVHGVGNLNVALEGHDLFMELNTPAANIVGFEHEPENDEQAHQLHETLELLGTAEKMFAFPATAGCESHETIINGEEMTGHHEKSGHHHKEGEDEAKENHGDHSGHSDIRATYQFKCDKPQELHSIDVQLFKHFHNFEKIEVQLLTSSNQTAATLTHDSYHISF